MEHKQPIVAGQSVQFLDSSHQHRSIISLDTTADHAIPEAVARVHGLRNSCSGLPISGGQE